MKVKPKEKIKVTEPPLSARHKYRRGDVLHLGLDELHICQVDYSAGEVYYSVRYKRRGQKHPRWGWVLAAVLDDWVVTGVDSKGRTHKKAKWDYPEEKQPTVKVIK